jgi:WD40 repeat protein
MIATLLAISVGLSGGMTPEPLTFSADGRMLACIGHNGLNVVEIGSGAAKLIAKIRDNGLGGKVRLSSTGAWVAAYTDEGIGVWATDTGKSRCQIKRSATMNFDLSPDGERVYGCDHWSDSSGEEGDLRVYDSATGNEIKRMTIHVEDVSVSPKGEYVALACRHGEVRLLNPSDLTISATFKTSEFSLLAVAFSQDGQYVVAAGLAKAAKDSGEAGLEVWSVADRKIVKTFPGILNRMTVGAAFEQGSAMVRATTMNYGWRGDGADPQIRTVAMPVAEMARKAYEEWTWSPDLKTVAQRSAGGTAVFLVDVASGKKTKIALK